MPSGSDRVTARRSRCCRGRPDRCEAQGMADRPLLRLALSVVAVVVLVAGGVALYQAGVHAGSAADASAGSTATAGSTQDPNRLKAQPIDVGFAADMIDHHDQAVQMALLVIDRSDSPAIRTLATEIATAQRREGGMLLQFLKDRGADHPDPSREVMAWMGEPTPHDQMPGLATTDQILALTNATGPELDRLFLQLMITHHEGGIHMAQFAMDHAESQDIRDLASRMIVDQKNEINDMQQLQGAP